MEEMRISQIEAHNRHLYEKLQTIESIHKQRLPTTSPLKAHHTLTARITNRANHTEKVNRENKQLLERLQDIKSNYNVQKWDK